MKSLSLLVASCALVLSFSAEATTRNLKNFKVTYPQAKVSGCVVCHTNQDDYARNSYGEALEQNSLDFKALEEVDSDGDGQTNLAEIIAGTYPGDKSSVPAVEGGN